MAPAAEGKGKLPPDVLKLDLAAEAEFIAAKMREIVTQRLRRRGVVVAVSGGIDSALCLALAAKAFGPQRTLALALPERESSAASLALGRKLAARFDVPLVVQDLTAALEGLGAYKLRDDAIRAVFPEFGPGWKSKIVIAGGLAGGFNHFKVVVELPGGEQKEAPLPSKNYLDIVAAQNHKQRLRKTMDYHHADRLHYAVVGTPNRLEFDQGFFVKNGDGAADLKPIAHLFKTQVYAMAEHLGVPEEICRARPTTDTYTLNQGQDEFYFALPYEKMDVALYALNNGYTAAALAQAVGISEDAAANVYKDIIAKRKMTQPLHAKTLLMRPVPEIEI